MGEVRGEANIERVRDQLYPYVYKMLPYGFALTITSRVNARLFDHDTPFLVIYLTLVP